MFDPTSGPLAGSVTLKLDSSSGGQAGTSILRERARLFTQVAKVYNDWKYTGLHESSLVVWLDRLVESDPGKELAVPEPAGLVNMYKCTVCEGELWVVLVDEGVTAMLLKCRATPRCPGDMESQWYNVDQDHETTHEFYRPTPAELRRKGRSVTAHVVRGGLLLRKKETP